MYVNPLHPIPDLSISPMIEFYRCCIDQMRKEFNCVVEWLKQLSLQDVLIVGIFCSINFAEAYMATSGCLNGCRFIDILAMISSFSIGAIFLYKNYPEITLATSMAALAALMSPRGNIPETFGCPVPEITKQFCDFAKYKGLQKLSETQVVQIIDKEFYVNSSTLKSIFQNHARQFPECSRVINSKFLFVSFAIAHVVLAICMVSVLSNKKRKQNVPNPQLTPNPQAPTTQQAQPNPQAIGG